MGQVKSYKDLEVYLLSKKLAVKVYKMTLDDLPKFEMFEEGSRNESPFRNAIRDRIFRQTEHI